MNVLVLGATGNTGALVVDRAIANGNALSVLVRDPDEFTLKGARAFDGDATNPEHELKAMQGQEAVSDTIGGGTPYEETHL
jgi:uncharacterized protein YbjT (DUF2867 family)